MARFLRFTTPTGSPAAEDSDAGTELEPRRHYPLIRPAALLTAILERQDPAGVVAVTFFALSSVSTALVWSIAADLFPMKHYHLAALFTRNVGMAFYVVSVGFGLLSEKRLSRWLSTYLLAIAVAWYGWDAVGLPGSLYPWNVISHTVIGLAIAVPALVAHTWRRLNGTA